METLPPWTSGTTLATALSSTLLEPTNFQVAEALPCRDRVIGPPEDRKIGRLFTFKDAAGTQAGPRPRSSTQAELQDECLGYCGAMSAIRAALPDYSDAAAIKAANSGALSGMGTVARSASRASIVGSASTARISRSRRAMTAAAVPLGAPTPAQVLASCIPATPRQSSAPQAAPRNAGCRRPRAHAVAADKPEGKPVGVRHVPSAALARAVAAAMSRHPDPIRRRC